MKKICLVLTSLVMLVATSCKKEKNTLNSTKSNNLELMNMSANEYSSMRNELLKSDKVLLERITFKYYYDNNIVNSIDFSTIENKYPVYSSIKNSSDSSAVIIINTFSSESKYYTYLENNGVNMNFRNHISFAQNYARERGIDINSDILELDSITNSAINNNYSLLIGFSTPLILAYDDFIPYGSSSLLLSSTPSLFWAWNNRIGGFNNTLGIYHVNIMYDRFFYNRHLATFHNWGFTFVSFHPLYGAGHVNNRTSSMLRF